MRLLFERSAEQTAALRKVSTLPSTSVVSGATRSLILIGTTKGRFK